MSMTRLEKVGTIYSRLRSALEAGVIKKEYTPMWLSIYEAFPPKHEPRFDRRPDVQGPAPKILYAEDTVRAAFYKQFGNEHEVFNLHDKNAVTLSTKFVRAFERAQEQGERPFEEAFVAAVDDLEAQGVNLREMDRRAAFAVPRREQSEGRVRRVRRAGQQGSRPKLATPSFQELFADDEEDSSTSKDKKS